MTNNIELIPLVELPTIKDEQSSLVPAGTAQSNPDAYNAYQIQELAKNYTNMIAPISPGVFQYSITEFSDINLQELTKLHVSDFSVEECCSFFGGYGLKMDDKIVLYPQCCGLLEEIRDWKKMLSDDFAPFYLSECHPAPRFLKSGENVIIQCLDDAGESFIPPTSETITVNHEAIKRAIIRAEEQLKLLSHRIDRLFQSEVHSRILIWGAG